MARGWTAYYRDSGNERLARVLSRQGCRLWWAAALLSFRPLCKCGSSSSKARGLLSGRMSSFLLCTPVFRSEMAPRPKKYVFVRIDADRRAGVESLLSVVEFGGSTLCHGGWVVVLMQ